MPCIDETQITNDRVLAAAKAGAIAALRAPVVARTKIKVEIITGDDLLPLAEILAVAGEINAFVKGDSVVVNKAFKAGKPVVELLIGSDTTVADLGWNCGACGFDTCAEFNRYGREHKSQGGFSVGPSCNWKVLDNGMALAYAAAAIAEMNVECRLQASYGFAAMAVGYLAGCSMGCGVSIGPGGQSIWYDRTDMVNSFTTEQVQRNMQYILPQLFIGFCGDANPPVKLGRNWNRNPKFFRPVEDPEFLAKRQDVGERIGKIIARERAKRTKS
jgi:uncharacterized ferredoxin-like protein